MSGDIHTLAGAYALDAVDDLERTAFERHLAACETCRLEVAELRETAARLADDVPDNAALPAGLRERTLALAARTPQERVDSPTGRRLGGWRQWVAAAVVAAVAAAGSSAVTWALVDRNQPDRTVAEQTRRIAEVIGAPDARVFQGTIDGGGSATLVASAQRDQAVVVLRDLPSPGTGRAYQLWLIPTTGAARQAGLLPGGDTTATTVVGPLVDVQAFGVSNEPEAGSPAPTDVVALLPLE
ncbi:anti-sigma factor [Micromonospora endophytica]|uniref:Regulator of SigK n=1 Tax=Micromonospora endophytica TaxID=515350 RepID=A0A2W2DM72_9ACTN|nr:anti-sigma factor [Micromonospora endophytica]PZG00828.1 anti-sigma factor [Micromonospora endophytica]RIW42059.1 anti-sigma factor [Micromonospora endophytica]BCJ59677.1 hypothetical protein Jiend_30990 [Micromonospora endophytica]